MRESSAPARLALTEALDDLNDAGRLTPCQRDPEPYTSDVWEDRQEAAAACRAACPVLALCRAYAEAAPEPWHVWGGKDRTGRKGQPRRSPPGQRVRRTRTPTTRAG